jgi:uncharacterized membrane protein
MSSFWTKADERFCEAVFDAAKRRRSIRRLSECRTAFIIIAVLTGLILVGGQVIALVRGNSGDTSFAVLLALVVFELTLLYHFDAQLKVLGIVGRLLEKQNPQQPEQTG